MRAGENSVHLVQPSAHGAKTTQALYTDSLPWVYLVLYQSGFKQEHQSSHVFS